MFKVNNKHTTKTSLTLVSSLDQILYLSLEFLLLILNKKMFTGNM